MNMCRICLTSSTGKDINQLKCDVDGTFKNHVDIFMFCFNIQIEADLDINPKLCLQCFDKILSFYEFKSLALKNDWYWKTGTLPEPEVFLKDTALESDIKSEKFLTYDIKEEDLQLDSNDYLDEEYLKEDKAIIKEEVPEIDDDLQDCHSDDEPLSVLRETKCWNYEERETIGNATIKRKSKIVKNSKQNTASSKIKKKEGRNTQKNDTAQMCEQCGKVVKNITNHSKLHLRDPNCRPLKCKGCDKTFSNASHRSHHYRVHHRQGKTECPICKKFVFYLDSHTKIKHDSSSLKFACSVCARRFLTRALLKQHMAMHTKHKPFQCEVCLAHFSTKVAVVQHKRLKHDNDKPHVCQFCSKAYIHKCLLEIHVRTHTNERPYECSQCGKRFADPSIHKNHVKQHSGERVSCTLCDKTFNMAAYLHMHMKTHTKEKPHQCKYCAMKFVRLAHRMRHEANIHEAKTHEGKKPKTVP